MIMKRQGNPEHSNLEGCDRCVQEDFDASQGSQAAHVQPG